MRQKPTVLEDHRTRYPREFPGLEDDPIEPPGDQPSYSDASGSDDLQIQLSPSSPLPPPASPIGSLDEIDLNHVPGQSTRASSPIRAPTPLEDQPAIPMSDDGHDQANEADEFMGDHMEIDHEYPFDRLLDNIPNLADHVDFFPDDVDELNDEVDENQNDDLYNENFGLPNDEDEHEADRPRFQLPQDDELEFEPEQEPEDDPGDEGGPEALSQAFQEHELIRNAYIDAFVQKVVYGATHRALIHMLKSSRRTIAAHPEVGVEDIANMAQTIRTVESRLGVNTDNIITTFTLCPTCWRLYTPEYIATTDNDNCLNEGCEGILFTLRNLASGSRRRVSNMTYPFASPVAWVRHMLGRPGMAELMQNWRDDEHGDRGLSAPVSSNEWMQTLDVNRPIGDISAAWGWRSTYAGLERREDPNTGDIVDENVLDPPIRFVSLPFGLSFSLNTDWLVLLVRARFRFTTA